MVGTGFEKGVYMYIYMSSSCFSFVLIFPQFFKMSILYLIAILSRQYFSLIDLAMGG